MTTVLAVIDKHRVFKRKYVYYLAILPPVLSSQVQLQILIHDLLIIVLHSLANQELVYVRCLTK